MTNETFKEFGWAVEPFDNKDHTLLGLSAATRVGDVITNHDLSGFMGSWVAKPSAVFFPSETGSSMCPVAYNKAWKYKETMELMND
jgi:hypothetical protein